MRRVAAILLALVAMGALGLSLLSRAWLTNVTGEAGFGLRENEACIGGATDRRCEELTNADVVAMFDAKIDAPKHFLDKTGPDASDPAMWQHAHWSSGIREHCSSAFVPLGWATSMLVGLGIFGLLIAAVIALVGKAPALPLSPTTIAFVSLGIGLVTGCVFVTQSPGPHGMLGVDVGFWLFGGGVLVGASAAQLLSRVIRPHDPDLMADAMDPDEF